jgi:hypothetical protein
MFAFLMVIQMVDRTNFQQVERKRRVNMLLNTLKEAESKGVEVSYKKLTAELCILWGSQEKTVWQYFDQLREAKRLEIDILSDKVFLT